MAKRRSKKREAVVRLFAQRLREMRTLQGMTQADLAESSDVSITYISQLESADTAPGIDLVSRLAQALGTTVGDLLPSADPPDSLQVLKDRTSALFARVMKEGDRESLLILAPILSLLVESIAKRG